MAQQSRSRSEGGAAASAPSGAHTTPGPWDPLIGELQDLRTSIGHPSYGLIAEMITERRLAAGAPAAAARVARSTVYDAFRLGRARVNLALIREIAAAMGASREATEAWIDACSSPVPPAAPQDSELPRPGAGGWRGATMALAMCLALNLVGREIVDFLKLPIYLDMVGTAAAAIALGPWRGAAVGAATNVIGFIGSGWLSLPFTIVNVAGALVWGVGVRRWGWGRSLHRFFVLNLLVAGVCTSLAVPILMLLFASGTGHAHDAVVRTLLDHGWWRLPAIAVSNLVTSSIDKLISGFVALVVVAGLPLHLRVGVPLVFAEQR